MTLITDAERLQTLTDLGEDVKITNGAASVQTRGIFQRQFVEVGNVESYHPTVQVCTHVLPVEGGTSVMRDDTIEVSAGEFTVIGVQTDGDGFTLLVLQEST